MTPLFDDKDIAVILLGNGYGESILVNFGNNEYLIVDSFLDQEKKPAPLTFLAAIGVPPENIKFIECSHWHSDHIKGLNCIAKQTDATFLMYALIKEKVFMKKTQEETENIENQELFKVLKTLQEKEKRPEYATGKKTIKTIDGKHFSHGRPVSIVTMSPQDEDYERFLNCIASGEYRHIPDPNEISIVTSITVGEDLILLGGDLEDSNSQYSGWKKVNTNLDDHFPNLKISVFKIPHHGSETGYSEEIWGKMKEDNVSGICSYRNGKSNLPTNEMISLYSNKANKLIINAFSRSQEIKAETKEAEQRFKNFNLALGGYSRLRTDFHFSIIKKSISTSDSAWKVTAKDVPFSEIEAVLNLR